MTNTEQVDVTSGDFEAARLHIENDREVAIFCAALNCLPRDIYVAVSMVGDKVRDIRSYLAKVLDRTRQCATQAPTQPRPRSLPPIWQSPHEDEEDSPAAA